MFRGKHMVDRPCIFVELIINVELSFRNHNLLCCLVILGFNFKKYGCLIVFPRPTHKKPRRMKWRTPRSCLVGREGRSLPEYGHGMSFKAQTLEVRPGWHGSLNVRMLTLYDRFRRLEVLCSTCAGNEHH